MTTKAAILRAIRQKCLDCSGGRPGEVRICPAVRCELWPYRMGSDPDPSPSRGFARSIVYTDDSGANADRGVVIPAEA